MRKHRRYTEQCYQVKIQVARRVGNILVSAPSQIILTAKEDMRGRSVNQTAKCKISFWTNECLPFANRRICGAGIAGLVMYMHPIGSFAPHIQH